MIIKERDEGEHSETDKFSKAGAVAEEQMAFYLRRTFVNDKDVYIINDLRMVDETEDRMQIDHLVLHRHGYVIVESKSVTSKVYINAQGEWTREWNGRLEGMQSPVQQTKFQIEFLRRVLRANCEQLLGKSLGILQKGLRYCPFEVIVAISDKGIIDRKMDLPEVTKADQAVDRIREIIRRHRKARSLLNMKEAWDFKNMDGVHSFTDEEMNAMSSFLVEHHFPLKARKSKTTYPDVTTERSVVRESAPDMDPALPASGSDLGFCDKCSQQSEIVWGRYGYYWKCRHCDNNMPIKEFCPECKKKQKLRKEKNKFFIYCEPCGEEHLYCEFEFE